MRGVIEPGIGFGKQIGIPTADIRVVDELVPKHGIYYVMAHFGEHRFCPGAAYIGPVNGLPDGQLILAVHLLDWDQPLDGTCMEIDFMTWLHEPGTQHTMASIAQTVLSDLTLARRLSGRVQGDGNG